MKTIFSATTNVLIACFAVLGGLGCRGSGHISSVETSGAGGYVLFVCDSRLTHQTDRVRLIEFHLPDLANPTVRQCKKSPVLNFNGLRRWGDNSYQFKRELANGRNDEIQRALKVPEEITRETRRSVRVAVSGVSTERDLLAIAYSPWEDFNSCEGYVYYSIRELQSGRSSLEFNRCYQSLDGSFSGFLEGAGRLGYVLDYGGKEVSTQDSERLHNKQVTAIESDGSVKAVDGVRATQIAASPAGGDVASLRFQEGQVVLEMRNEKLSAVRWSKMLESPQMPWPKLFWSEDGRLVGVLLDFDSNFLLDIYDAESGNPLVSGSLSARAVGYLPGAILLVRWNEKLDLSKELLLIPM